MLTCNPGGFIKFYGYGNFQFIWTSLVKGNLVADYIEISPLGFVAFYSINRIIIHRI